jgi:HTH-type transcriptional regulator/antitoxin MqsA
MTIAYKGFSATFEMPGWYCDNSDEGVHTDDDMKTSDRELNRLKARADGVLEPERIRQIRKKLKLTQREAGLLIGGGPNSFQKYESGEVLASHAITSALLLLEHDPAGLAVLRNQARHAAE